MLKARLPLSLTLALLFSAAVTYPQQSAPPAPASTRYSQSLYLKVAPGKDAALVDFYKTGPGGKAVRARMKADPDLVSWSLRQIRYEGEQGREATAVIVTGTNGVPKEADPAKRDEMYRAAIGMGYAQYVQAAQALAQISGASLSHVHHVSDGFTFSEGDYVRAVRIKTVEGRSQEYSALIRDLRFPVVNDLVKSGGGALKAYAFSHLTFPSGSNLEWDTTQTYVYKNLADAVGSAGTAGSGQAARFAKLFPNKSYLTYMDGLRATSKIVKTDLYRIAVAIQP